MSDARQSDVGSRHFGVLDSTMRRSRQMAKVVVRLSSYNGGDTMSLMNRAQDYADLMRECAEEANGLRDETLLSHWKRLRQMFGAAGVGNRSALRYVMRQRCSFY